jgi:hypothetical protein
MPGELLTDWRDRVFADLGAIACWLVLWVISVALGMALSERDRYGSDLATALWPFVIP